MQANAKVKNKVMFGSSTKAYHMILTDQPRLFMMTDFNPHDKDPQPQKYKKDILLYPGLKAMTIRRNKFEIMCKASGKKWEYETNDAGKWTQGINEIVGSLS